MKRLIRFITILAIVAAYSCSDKVELPKLNYSVNDKTEYLTNSRVEYYGNIPIQLTDISETSNKTSTKSKRKLSLHSGFKSPVYDGDTLSASSLRLYDGYLYISYNLQGEKYAGALNILDVRNKSKIKLLEEVIFHNTDINVVRLSKDKKKLWLGGSNKTGSTILTVCLKDNGRINSSEIIKSKNLNRGSSTNGIAEHKNKLFVSVGNTNGGNYVLDIENNYEILQEFSFTQSKSVAFMPSNKYIVLQGGENAELKIYDEEDGIVSYKESFTCGAPMYHRNVPDIYKYSGKNTICLDKCCNECYIAMGANGAILIDLDTGEIIGRSPDNMLKEGNTNSIWTDECNIYMANGADGVAFADLPNNSDTDFKIMGIWDDEEYPGSANFVYSDGSYIYIAKGKEGGLKILKID